jgi:uncharacterized phosphosugar-binding protein
MNAQTYFDAVQERIARLGREELPAIQQAGELVAGAIAAGGRVWMTRTSHTLHGEATDRAGGLMAVHELHDPITVQPGDVVIAGTNAGTLASHIDLADAVKARGARLIVITQLPFEQAPDVVPSHPSGRRLSELADVVIDLGGLPGDAELPFAADGLRLLPSSGVTGVLALWMVFAEATGRLTAQGTPPLVWQAMQMPGAMERNAATLRRYRATGLGYEDRGRR